MYKTDKWELKYFKNEEKIEIIVREDDGRITNGFAEIPCYGEDDVSYDDQWEIARLLVAAPALLAAYKAVTKSLECMRLGDRNMPPCNENWQCCVCEAQAAISAANAGTTQK